MLRNIDKEQVYVNYLYFYIFITPWFLFKSQVLIFGLIALVWVVYLQKKQFLINLKKIAIFFPILIFLIYILFTYIMAFFTENIMEALSRVFNYTKYYLLLIPPLLVFFKKRNAEIAIRLLVFSFTLYAVYMILIYLGILHLDGTSSSRPQGHLRYSIIGQYMVIGTLLNFFYFIYSDESRYKLFYFISMLLTFFALFINHSRTAQVAFFLVLAMLIFIFMKNNKERVKYILVSLGIFSIAFIILLQNNKLDRYKLAINEVSTVINEKIYTGSFGVRLFFNKTGIEVIKENPFFGVGPYDNRLILVEKQKNDLSYRGDDGKRDHFFNHYHSEHMDILTAYGIFGYLLLVSGISMLIYKLRNDKFYFKASISVFLTLFFISFATKTLSLKPINYVYVLFFFLFAIIALKKDNIEN